MRHLVGALQTVASSVPFRKYFPLLLQECYEEDLLDEEVIMGLRELDLKNEGAHRAPEELIRKDLWNRAEPFIRWLREAEEASESEEE